jgi:hypothetical protein
MTISDARCDRCGVPVSGLGPSAAGEDEAGEDELGQVGGMLSAGVRFGYHPGDPSLRDDSGVLCRTCWRSWEERLGSVRPRVCAVCGVSLQRVSSLFVRPVDRHESWQLCAPDAADLLNTLRTVEPKLDRETFRLPRQPRTEGDVPPSETVETVEQNAVTAPRRTQ